MCTAEPLVPEPNVFEFEMVIEKQNRYKSPGMDQVRAEFTRTGRGRGMCLRRVYRLLFDDASISGVRVSIC